jgi:hypothetical protein
VLHGFQLLFEERPSAALAPRSRADGSPLAGADADEPLADLPAKDVTALLAGAA